MSVSDTFFAEKNTWVSSAKHFLSNKKETTDFTVYLRNSTNPIVSLTLRQAIQFSFSIADQQLCKLLLAICPFRQPNIIITASHFICQPLPGKSSRQTHEHVTVHAYVSSNGICRGFAFQYGKFLLPPRFLTALSVPKVPTREQKRFFLSKIPTYEQLPAVTSLIRSSRAPAPASSPSISFISRT